MARRSLASLGLLAALTLCGHSAAVLPPCEYQSQARAEGPASASDLEPIADAPRIVMADRFDLGEKITARVEGTALPTATAFYRWTLPEGVSEEVGDGGRALFLWAREGKYTIRLAITYTIQVLTPDPADQTKGVPTTLVLPPYEFAHTFSVGAAPAPPTPPPGPTPPPTPTPTPPPAVEGRRTVVLLHESQDDSAAFARMAVQLRTGEQADYLKAKGHTLLILDDDSTDQLGNRPKLVVDLLAVTPQLPALFVLDSATGAVLHSRPLTDAANAAGVLAVLKEYGG